LTTLQLDDAKPKVTDFGLAKFTQDGADLTGSGQVVGTPHYMAPEQAAGSKQTGPAVDVYALGAILFECLTGRSPFQGNEPMSVLVQVVTDPAPDLRSLRSDVPRDLSAVVMRCLNKDPRRRYSSAEELANDLQRFLDGRPTRARPVTIRERTWLWARRNPAVTALVATLAAVLVVAFGAVTYLWIEARDTAQRERFAKERAELAEGHAVAAHSQATAALAHLEFARAVTWCEEGRIREGLDLFVHAVELAEATGGTDLARVARLNLAAWPRELPRQRVAFPHAQQPRLAAFHPDGTHMVTAGRGSAVQLWNTSTKRKVRTYRPGIIKPFYRLTGVTYWTVAISPDGKSIAAGSSEGSITVWNTDSPDPRMSFDAVEGEENVWSVAFAPDGTLWANDGQSGLKQWNIQGLKPKLVRHGQPTSETRAGILQVIAVAPDGRRIYSGDRAGAILEWNAEKATELRNWDAGGWVQDLAVSPDGKRIAATGPAGIARIINLDANRVERDIDLASVYGNGIAFAPTAPFLLTSDGDGTVRTWHRESGMPIGQPFRFSGEVTKIRFRPGSEEFAVPAGNSVFLCKIPDPPGDLVTAGYGQRVRGLDIAPTGKQVAISDDEGFELLDPFTARRLQRVDYSFSWPYYRRQDAPLTLRFDPNPKRPRVFRGTRSGLDYLAVPGGHWAKTVAASGLDRIGRIDFLDGGRIVLAADDRLVARWDAEFRHRPTVEPVENMPAGVEVRALAARPDGQEVLIAFANRVVFLDPETLKPRRPGWTTGDEILDTKYTPDGTRVLIGRRDNVAELRNAKDGALAARPMPHGKAVLAVAVSPDGKVLLTGSRDGTARFWDAQTGLPIGAPLRHLGPVTHLVYAPNGDHALTGTGTGHVLLWDTPPAAAKGTPVDLRAAIQRRD
jgi:WD40 repeat protein